MTTHPLLSAEVYKKSTAIPLFSLKACAAYNRVKPYLIAELKIGTLVFHVWNSSAGLTTSSP
jgi:hypothetical protein